MLVVRVIRIKKHSPWTWTLHSPRPSLADTVNNNNKRPLTPKSMRIQLVVNKKINNKRPLIPKSMPPASDEHAKLKT